ncbi:NAD-dependent epimerase/dehydratase family protein [Verminephrobacter eiseniae]|uniref:NAD-dependent epimerase/dehydratase n=1 Tax=Verminephrobacter eiseniae (strain EF01-2) TaxID=391735 RepID=A1WR61_VEREI|nr:NAD-dependent epimerase/dehydratase family protein [Verminephrobacter eiseniae]ABM60118.1 NAD-dependent epimerase/dehydratase [Verminephrobacter eiseniae EF01-2]MCW5285608.1 NAD-dependent epimerase/dehydratase family protein [Verminephrobacter eiseniae]MCW5303908.1 NAD-dependent epimerase/dehydratase family protein [Verminephrobacter eiseniae]MCW8181052.1 NAD-dependent epimerase/dehydratase family protein [Verminephrobacter eiseniae]MCW8192246.1 NAD-dependent epimerase/dehydratase family pr
MSGFTVLGASGYIGSHLVPHLRALGHSVWAPARGAAEVLTRPLGHVLYCVGLTGDFRTRPFDTVAAHVGLLAELLRRARFDSLLYLSSTRVYQGAGRTDEDAPLALLPGQPCGLYNLSKLCGEALCHASGRAGVRVARLSNVVGPGMDAASGNLLASLVQQARQGHVQLRSDPRSVKDYLHLADLLDWLPQIALTGRATVYNVASGLQTSHAQWLAWLQQRTGCTVHWPEDAPLQQFAPIAVHRLRAEWGWRPRPVFSDDLFVAAPAPAAPLAPSMPAAPSVPSVPSVPAVPAAAFVGAAKAGSR